MSTVTGPASVRRAPRAALQGARQAHGGATACPSCGHVAETTPRRARLTELELEVNPVGPVHPGMLMEHLGHAAAESESEAEAEAFIGALVPLAAQLIPRAAPVINRVAPQLIQGAVRVGQTLWRDPATRRLVRAVPTIVSRTARTVVRQAARGRPVTPQYAVRTLARQADRVLSDPRERVRVQRRSQRIDRRYHRAACPRTYTPGTRDPLADRGPLRPVDVSWNPLIRAAGLP